MIEECTRKDCFAYSKNLGCECLTRVLEPCGFHKTMSEFYKGNEYLDNVRFGELFGREMLEKRTKFMKKVDSRKKMKRRTEMADAIKRCCETCEWYVFEEFTSGKVCVNGDSPYCADFTKETFVCDEWELKLYFWGDNPENEETTAETAED